MPVVFIVIHSLFLYDLFSYLETEKYAHVTFFFNGGVEAQYELEGRKLVPSPKVPTYDLEPPMSSAGVADEVGMFFLFVTFLNLFGLQLRAGNT